MAAEDKHAELTGAKSTPTDLGLPNSTRPYRTPPDPTMAAYGREFVTYL